MGSIVLNIVRISEVICSSFLNKGGRGVQALIGDQVQDHGGFCKGVQVCVCYGDFEESPIPRQKGVFRYCRVLWHLRLF